MRNRIETAIETAKLAKTYGRNSAVENFNFLVRAGSSVGLLGPNGAGKSTALKMLLGLVRPTSGKARVLGKDPSSEGPSIRACVGYVPERHHIYGWMTVGEVFRFVRPFYPTWNDQLCRELVQSYALPLEKRVCQLSHGMGTKLSLVLALAHEPELLILDEPTTGLDPLAREEFVDSIAQLLSNLDKTVVFSSHILSDIDRVVDTVAIMCGGTLLTVLPRAELVKSTKRVHVTLHGAARKPAAPRHTLFERLEGNVWSLTLRDFSPDVLAQLETENSVQSIHVCDMTLEEIFKDYVKGQGAA